MPIRRSCGGEPSSLVSNAGVAPARLFLNHGPKTRATTESLAPCSVAWAWHGCLTRDGSSHDDPADGGGLQKSRAGDPVPRRLRLVDVHLFAKALVMATPAYTGIYNFRAVHEALIT